MSERRESSGVFLSEQEIMHALRARLEKFSATRQTFVPVEPTAFRHLDLAFYERTRAAFEAEGFTHYGDFVIPELKETGTDLRCFVRTLVTTDGVCAAACYHPKPVWWWRVLLWIFRNPMRKIFEIETEFSDDVFIISTNAPDSGLLVTPPLFLREGVSPSLTPMDMCRSHRAKVAAYLRTHPGVSVRRVTDVASLVRMQNRHHAVLGAHIQMMRGCSVEDLQRLGRLSKDRAEYLKQLMDAPPER
jgi:hypothetical protein